MKKYLPLILTALLISCSEQENPFLSQFEAIESFPFTIESTSYIDDDSTYGFIGKVMENTANNSSGIELFRKITDETYSCYQFKVSANIQGLILRTPSADWSSSIKLCLYDQAANEIVQCLEVAEIYGDDGYEFSKITSLQKSGDGFVLELTKHECETDEDFVNITCADSLFSYSIKGADLVLTGKKAIGN